MTLISSPNLNGIFKVGVGRDNVPEKEAREKGILVRFPSKKTVDIIYNETASFTCSLNFRMLYSNVGTLNPWFKTPRNQLSKQNLLLIGAGKIGSCVTQLMKPFMHISIFDLLQNRISELKQMIQKPYIGKLKEFYPNRFYMTPHVASTCKGFLEGCRKNLNDLITELEHS